MSKRKQPRSLDIASTDSASPFDTLEQLTALGYEGVAKDLSKGSGAVRAVPTDIFAIYPDLAQPRRAVPSEFRGDWDGDPQTLAEQIFEPWLKWVEQERGRPFDLDEYLNDDDNSHIAEGEGASLPGALEASLLAIVNLAGSIYRDGLMNAITVVHRGQQYQLETGERRWLAYHLLYAHTHDEQWSKIPARMVEQINVWRQASENNARADLNAIGKARQLALLLMDLLEREGQQFVAFDQFDDEREFYAQVADGHVYGIPKGKGQLLLSAMGLQNGVQLRQYRRLLRLPDRVWQLADDFGWPENLIHREILTPAASDEDVIELAEKLAVQENSVSILTHPKPLSRKMVSEEGLGTRRYFVEFTRLLNKAERGKPEINREALRRVQEMKTWLDEQERRISEFLD